MTTTTISTTIVEPDCDEEPEPPPAPYHILNPDKILIDDDLTLHQQAKCIEESRSAVQKMAAQCLDIYAAEMHNATRGATVGFNTTQLTHRLAYKLEQVSSTLRCATSYNFPECTPAMYLLPMMNYLSDACSGPGGVSIMMLELSAETRTQVDAHAQALAEAAPAGRPANLGTFDCPMKK